MLLLAARGDGHTGKLVTQVEESFNKSGFASCSKEAAWEKFEERIVANTATAMKVTESYKKLQTTYNKLQALTNSYKKLHKVRHLLTFLTVSKFL